MACRWRVPAISTKPIAFGDNKPMPKYSRLSSGPARRSGSGRRQCVRQTEQITRRLHSADSFTRTIEKWCNSSRQRPLHGTIIVASHRSRNAEIYRQSRRGCGHGRRNARRFLTASGRRPPNAANTEEPTDIVIRNICRLFRLDRRSCYRHGLRQRDTRSVHNVVPLHS